MSVKTYDPGVSDGGADNWKVAQRLVDAFAPHAQNEPTMSVVIDQGALLDGTTLTEVATQIVGPFTAPASGHRVDRIVIDRATGSASIVSGTDGSLVVPAIPDGTLPVARVLLNDGTVQITNDILFDERALFDLGPSINDNLTALSQLDATPGLVEQTGAATFTKRAIGAASGSDVPTRDDADARYVLKSGDTMTGALTLPGDPTAALEAAPKQYVDQEIADAVAAITPASIGAADAQITITGSGLLTGGGDLTADRVITMTDVATDSVIGRIDAGTGAPSAIATPMIDIITAADASGARDVLELGDAATHDVGVATGTDIPTRDDADARYLNKSGDAMTGALTLAADPAAPLEAATKRYVDNLAAGFDVKPSVKAAGVADLTLSGEQNVDNVALSSGDRVLVKDQAVAANNGVYVVASGAWSRADDMALWSQLPGAFLFVEQGDANADTGWVCTVDQGGAIGTDAIAFTQFAGIGAFAPLSRQILAGTGLSGGGDMSADRTLSLADTAVAPGAYGSASSVAGFTVDQQGRVTAATEIAVTPAAIGAQAESDELDALATIATTGLLVRDGDASATTRAIAGSGIITVTDGDGVAGDPTIATSMSSGALLGRSSAGTGEVEEITLGSGLSLDAGVLNAAGGTAEVTQSGPTYLASGNSTTITGTSVLTAYEQIAGQTFDLTYNTEADFAQQDATNGTDLSSGRFVLHNTAGAEIDEYTKLLIHADGENGSTEIVDNRNITPFGTNCGYFDGTAFYKVPSSYKMAFGSGDLTIEGWFHTSSALNGNVGCFFDSHGGVTRTYFNALNKIVCGTIGLLSGTLNYNQWYHVALVRSSGTWALYVDGTSQGTSTYSASLSSSELMLGTYTTILNTFNGWMDEVRVSKVARYTADFTPPTAAFTRDDDTVYLFHFDDGHGSRFLRDASESGHEVAAYGSSALSATTSKFGGTSAHITGQPMRVEVSKNNSDFDFGSEDFTIDLWLYPTQEQRSAILAFETDYHLGIDYNQYGTRNINIWASSNGTTWDLINGDNSGNGIGSISLTLNAWNHVAFTREGDVWRSFVNGALDVEVTVSGSVVSRNEPLLLGKWGTPYTHQLSGYIDELRIKRGVAEWTESFTPPTAPYITDDRTILLCHFEGADGDQVTLDSSGSSYGTAEISATTIPALAIQSGYALSSGQTRGGHGTSLKFGTAEAAKFTVAAGDLVAGHPLNTFDGSVPFCIEGWFHDAGTNGEVFYALHNGATQIHVRKTSPTTLNCSAGSTVLTGAVTNNAWNHFAWVQDAVGQKLYINGAMTATASHNVYALPNTYATVFSFGGGNGGSGLGSSAYIDSFRITNGKPRYTANFTPGDLVQDDDTALLWVFDGSDGQTWVKELSKNTAIIKSTNARTVSDGRYIQPTALALTTTDPKFGSASIDGDGSSSASLPFSSDWQFGTGPFVVEFWAKPGSDGAAMAALCHGTDPSNYWSLYRDVTGHWAVHSNPKGGTFMLDPTVSPAGEWRHVAWVRSGTGANQTYLYVNGVKVVTATDATDYAFTGVMYVARDLGGALNHFVGQLDEIRVSKGTDRGWTGATIPVPTIPYGQQYVSGPYWVATKPGASALDLTGFSSVNGAVVNDETPPGTTLNYLISTDGYATALKRWNGSAWVDTAYSMSWDGSALTTAATAAQLNAVGNTATELRTGLAALDAASVGSLNIVAMLATSNATFTPALDDIQLVMDEYTLLRPVTDYTVSRKQATGEQTLTITRVKSGNANHVFDVV